MKQYTKPEFELIMLDMNDIIATSTGTFSIIDGEMTDPDQLGAPDRSYFFE